MEWAELAAAFGVACILQGLGPFASPVLFRAALRLQLEKPDEAIRAGGLVLLAAGFLLMLLT